MTDEDALEIRCTLREARDCIEDLGRGEGGWAWEEVLERIDRALAVSSQDGGAAI